MANANEAHVFNLANASLPFLANANEARGFNLVGACLCSPGPMFPGSYVPRVLCSPLCMRLGNIGPFFLYLSTFLDADYLLTRTF